MDGIVERPPRFAWVRFDPADTEKLARKAIEAVTGIVAETKLWTPDDVGMWRSQYIGFYAPDGIILQRPGLLPVKPWAAKYPWASWLVLAAGVEILEHRSWKEYGECLRRLLSTSTEH